MRSLLRKLLSAVLSAALLTGALPAYASDALGHDLAVRDTELSAGTELAAGTFWSDSSSDFRRENYVVYTPSARVSPIVTYGDTTRALTTTPAIARGLEEQGWRVVAGINGDYYGVAHGVPLGSTMTNGVLRNVNHDPYYAVGFRADGTALIGNPDLHIYTRINGAEGPEVFAFNHVRLTAHGLFLYDHNFNSRHTTGTSEPGVDVILSCPNGGALTLGGMLSMRVEEVLPQATDTAVPEGGYILTANLQAGDAYTAPLLALQPGDELLVSVMPWGGSGWNEVQNLIGAPELLVQNGTVMSGLPTGSAPRTAIGQRADGSLLFYTIDGRRSGHSVGATLTMVAMRLVELGCVTAVALDGGGSTTLVATMPDETSARVVNTPSEGSVRAVSNHVFLVAPNTPGGAPDHIYLAPAAPKALPGARVALSAAVIDSNYIPVASGRALTYTADAGSVDADGVLTLPAGTGPVTVTASYGGLSASAVVEAVEPDAILFKQNGSTIWSLTIAPGSDAALSAQGVLNHLALPGGNDCFEWTYEGTGVTLLPDGSLHAGKDAGAGTLTVSAGEKKASLPVTVAVVPLQTLADFEEPFEPLTDLTDEMLAASPNLKPSLTLTQTADAAHVQFGRAAAQLAYTLDGENPAYLPVRYSAGAEYNCVELWVYGDGSETVLALETDAGPSAAATLSFTGWKPIALTLPSGARSITAVSLTSPKKASGTVWLDQLVLAYDYLVDIDPPEVSLTVDAEANTLTGRAFDAVNGAALPTLRLSYDGAALEYSSDSRTGALSAVLPAPDGLAHHVALTAGDACGNLARASVVIPAAEDAAPAFPDAEGHWAAGAIEFLKRTGVSNGDDRGLFNPDANITRQEFAAMLFRYLTPEEDFSGVKLPFADSGDIAAWALEPARAMYALGVVNGSLDDDGKLRYHPQSSITRREAVTMLGRLLEKGYVIPEPSYSDSADIPGWAAPHAALLGALGVLDDFVADTFSPAVPITRSEFAACLLRLN